MRDVILVDGVGRPRVVAFIEPGPRVEFAHEGITDKRQHRVKFDLVEGLTIEGKPVYRMRAPGDPPQIRLDYLRVSQMVPFNPPREPPC